MEITSEKIVAISEAFFHQVALTGSVSMAFDKVFGEGTYAGLADALYDALRAK